MSYFEKVREKLSGEMEIFCLEQVDSTTVITPNTWFEVDIHGNLIVNAFGDGKGGDEA